MELKRLEIWVVAAPMGGGTWIYTVKEEAEQNYEAAIKMNVESYKEMGREVEVVKNDTFAFIKDAKDGRILQMITCQRPMNGQGVLLYTDKEINMKTFHTSYGAAVSIKKV